MKNIYKILILIIILFFLYLVMLLNFNIKKDITNEIYKKSQIILSATEISQYIDKIELNLKFGKELDDDNNMQNMIKKMSLLSSYIDGTYLISDDGVLLYSYGVDIEQIDEAYIYESNGELVDTIDFGDYSLAYMDIKKQDGSIAGILMLMFDIESMSRLYDDYQRLSFIQSIAITSIFSVLMIVIALNIFRKNSKNMIFKLLLMVCIIILLSSISDIVVEIVKLDLKIEQITSQSVQNINNVLQQQIDSVIDKGVSKEDLSDVYNWLKVKEMELDAVDILKYDIDGKVKSNIDMEHVNNTVRQASVALISHILKMIAVFSILIGLVYWKSKYNTHKHLK